MSAERTPRDDEPLLAAPLAWLAAAAGAHAWWTLAVGVLLALASLGFAYVKLTLRTGRGDLIRPDAEYHRRWVSFCEEFAHQDDVLVLVEGLDVREIAATADEIAAELAKRPELFHAILHRLDQRPLKAKGLHYLAADDLRGVALWTGRYAPIVQGDWNQLRLEQRTLALGDQVRRGDPQAAWIAADELERIAGSVGQMLQSRGEYRSPWPILAPPQGQFNPTGGEHFLVPLRGGKQIGVVALRLAIDDKPQFVPGGEAIGELRRILTRLRSRHPTTALGLTGLPVLEFDEMQASQRDMLIATLVSLGGVALLFVAGFGGVRQPLLCIVSLALALAWSCGYITLAVGHLNILSMAFAVMLIGLGIDFGIHLALAYAEHRAAELPPAEALAAAARQVGPGIVTGAVTTATAFFVMALTDFLGLGELGIIAGGGILLCCVATFTVLPALLATFELSRLTPRVEDSRLTPAARHESPPIAPLAVDQWFAPLHRWPLGTLVLMSLGVLAAGWALPRLWYDHNLLHLQSPALESVAWEEKLLGETELSVWHAVSVAKTREELLARKAAFAKLPTVARVEEIGSLIPAADPARRQLIEQIHRQLERVPSRPMELAAPKIEPIVAALKQAADAIRAKLPPAAQIAAGLDGLAQQLAVVPPQEAVLLLDGYQRGLVTDVVMRLQALRASSDPAPPAWSDLPPGMVTRFVGRSGQQALRIYSRGKAWDMPALERFVEDVQSVDPEATGQPLETFYGSRQMQQSYLVAGLYALLAVVVLVMLDFGSTRSTLWAMTPVALGLVQTLGLMAWLGLPLNPANMIVLPLVIGTGIDYGVHVLHDYRRRGAGPYRLSGATATAVLLSGLTTVVGFGSLMLADHQGLASLGRVLTLGITSCMLHSLVTLPAYLAWRTAKAKPPSRSASAAPPDAAVPADAPEPTATEPAAETNEHEPEAEPNLPRRTRRRLQIDEAQAAEAAPVGNPRRRRRVRLE